MVSIAISFLIMIISVAVSSGFREELRDGISDLTGDVQLVPADMNYINDTSPMSSSPDFLDEVKAMPEVRRIVPAVYRAGIIKNGENIHGVVFKGVPVEKGEADSIKLAVRIPSRLRDLIGVEVISRHTRYLPVHLLTAYRVINIAGQTLVHIAVTAVSMECTVQIDQTAIEEYLNRVGERIAV